MLGPDHSVINPHTKARRPQLMPIMYAIFREKDRGLMAEQRRGKQKPSRVPYFVRQWGYVYPENTIALNLVLSYDVSCYV